MGHKGKPKSEYFRVEYPEEVFRERWFYFAIWAAGNGNRKVEFCPTEAFFFDENDAKVFKEEILAP